MGFEIDTVKSEDDRQNILNLWKRNLPLLSKQRLNWFYDQNPTGKSVTVKATTTSSTEVVGSGSYFQRDLKVGNDLRTIAIASDFSIDKKYRLFGPAMAIQNKLVNQIQENSEIFGGVAFPNKSGMGVFKRAGYDLVGEAEFWSLPLSTFKLWKSKLKSKLLIRFLTFFSNIALGLALRVKINSMPTGLSFVEVKDFDERINTLWDKARLGYDITPVRNYEYLNWRYVENPVDQYLIYCLIKNGEFFGYVVFKEVDDFYEIVDMFSENNKKIYACLLQGLVKLALKNNKTAICLSFIGGSNFTDVLKNNWFRLNLSVNRPLLGTFKNKEILTSDRWFVFEGDMDL